MQTFQKIQIAIVLFLHVFLGFICMVVCIVMSKLFCICFVTNLSLAEKSLQKGEKEVMKLGFFTSNVDKETSSQSHSFYNVLEILLQTTSSFLEVTTESYLSFKYYLHCLKTIVSCCWVFNHSNVKGVWFGEFISSPLKKKFS